MGDIESESGSIIIILILAILLAFIAYFVVTMMLKRGFG